MVVFYIFLFDYCSNFQDMNIYFLETPCNSNCKQLDTLKIIEIIIIYLMIKINAVRINLNSRFYIQINCFTMRLGVYLLQIGLHNGTKNWLRNQILSEFSTQKRCIKTIVWPRVIQIYMSCQIGPFLYIYVAFWSHHYNIYFLD